MKEEKLKKQSYCCQLPNTKHQTQSGITLVALVITVIILLILAGVAMSMITGQDGLFSRAENAATKYNEAAQNEAEDLKEIIHELNKINANFKLSATDIKCREFTINAEIEGIKEEITEIEYFVNGESIGTTTEKTFLVENLEPETDYSVHIKAYNQDGNYYESGKTTIRTADKVYLVKNGQILVDYELKSATINTTYTDRIRVQTSGTEARAGINILPELNLTEYKRMYVDIEFIKITTSSTVTQTSIHLFKLGKNVTSGNGIIQNVTTKNNATSKVRTIEELNTETINEQVQIFIYKNSTNPASSAIFDICNLWFEI